MSISASDVSKLRQMTGAGMMDCKNALDESNGNIETAAELLRKKGITKAAKRAGKTAAEGVVNFAINDNKAVVVEINSETDFVAKNDDFKQVVTELTEHLLASDVDSVETAMTSKIGETTVEEYLTNATAKIGEKISLRRLQVFTKEDGEVLGAYNHMNGKIITMVLMDKGDEDLARDIAMHSAAANPIYLDRSQVPAEVIAKEKEVYAEQLKNEGKPENIIEKILEGKINKFYEDVCLVDQTYVKDDKKKIKEILPEGATIKEFVRFELGEGIEKKKCDFVSEVQEQMG